MTDIKFCPLNPALIELKDTLRLAASTFYESTADHRRAAVLWSQLTGGEAAPSEFGIDEFEIAGALGDSIAGLLAGQRREE